MKILVIDDHPVVRHGIVTILKSIGPDTIVLEAESAESALNLVKAHMDLDITILDIFMPGAGGWAGITSLGQARPDVPVLVMSSSESPRHVQRAISLGALGYVPKSASPKTLLAAVQFIMDGETYIPTLTEDAAAQSLSTVQLSNGSQGSLTPRQIDVLKLLAEGLSNKIIARRLQLSEKTVKAHVGAIFKVFNVLNRTQAVIAGRNCGLL
jgi:two-component system, NarL family, nitrate/nitrite response regulator NarL